MEKNLDQICEQMVEDIKNELEVIPVDHLLGIYLTIFGDDGDLIKRLAEALIKQTEINNSSSSINDES